MEQVDNHYPLYEIQLMNILSPASSAANLPSQPFNSERTPEAFSGSRKIKESPPQHTDSLSSQMLDALSSDSLIREKSIAKKLTDRMPETTQARITITDSGEKMDINTAWEKVVISQKLLQSPQDRTREAFSIRLSSLGNFPTSFNLSVR